MAEWRVVLKHKNGIDRVEIIGIGPDPHNPSDVIKTSRGPIGKRLLEKIEERKEIDYPPPIIPIRSLEDMYLYHYVAAGITESDSDWEIESNLPKLPDPKEEHERDEVLII